MALQRAPKAATSSMVSVSTVGRTFMGTMRKCVEPLTSTYLVDPIQKSNLILRCQSPNPPWEFLAIQQVYSYQLELFRR